MIYINNVGKIRLLLILGLILLPALGVIPLFLAPFIDSFSVGLTTVFLAAGAAVTAYAMFRIPCDVMIGENVKIVYSMAKWSVEWDQIQSLETTRSEARFSGIIGRLLPASERFLTITTRDSKAFTVGIDVVQLMDLKRLCEVRQLPFTIRI